MDAFVAWLLVNKNRYSLAALVMVASKFGILVRLTTLNVCKHCEDIRIGYGELPLVLMVKLWLVVAKIEHCACGI